MIKWSNMKAFLLVALALVQCGSSRVILPTVSDLWKETQASEETKKLDAQVTGYLRGQFTIASAQYYLVPGMLGWASISKSVENEMRDRSVYRMNESSLDLVEVYLQGSSGGAFAIAMLDKVTHDDEKDLIGIYVLKAPKKKK